MTKSFMPRVYASALPNAIITGQSRENLTKSPATSRQVVQPGPSGPSIVRVARRPYSTALPSHLLLHLRHFILEEVRGYSAVKDAPMVVALADGIRFSA